MRLPIVRSVRLQADLGEVPLKPDTTCNATIDQRTTSAECSLPPSVSPRAFIHS